MLSFRKLAVALCVVTGTHTLTAHDPGFSSAYFQMQADAIQLRLAFNNSDVVGALPALDRNADGTIDDRELQTGRVNLVDWLRNKARLVTGETTLVGEVQSLAIAENEDIVLQLSYPSASQIRWSLPLLQDLARGHRQYVAVRDAAGNVLAEGLLHRGQPELNAKATEPTASTAGTFGRFLILGIEHILIGFDHILFLLGLLVVGCRLRQVLWTITAFTISHSVTLAAASLGLVSLPGGLVEAVIALSIVWVGVQNIRNQQQPGHARFGLTFLFGLIHGFGFASVLSELGMGSSAAVPLLAFNLGVELGQLMIAAAVLPVFWWLYRKHQGQHLNRILSGSIVVAGSYWLVERTLL